MNILETLAQSNREIIKKKKENKSLNELSEEVNKIKETRPSFKKALEKPGISFICELKKASPSKGLICPDFDYLKFAHEYEDNGVNAISCLTEPTKFLGSLKILEEVTNNINLPVLRKDFIVDPYQIYEAKLAGASAVLLIVALLEQDELESLFQLTKQLGMDALVEVHNLKEINKALTAGVDIIGINNRDLRDFTVDLKTSAELSKYLPETVIRISESGIHSAEDVKFLAKNNFNGVLIGEQLMTGNNIPDNLKQLMNYEN